MFQILLLFPKETSNCYLGAKALLLWHHCASRCQEAQDWLLFCVEMYKIVLLDQINVPSMYISSSLLAEATICLDF